NRRRESPAYFAIVVDSFVIGGTATQVRSGEECRCRGVARPLQPCNACDKSVPMWGGPPSLKGRGTSRGTVALRRSGGNKQVARRAFLLIGAHGRACCRPPYNTAGLPSVGGGCNANMDAVGPASRALTR